MSTEHKRAIPVSIWSDENFRNLSQNAQYLWLFLMTGPLSEIVHDKFCEERLHIAETLGWTPRRFDRAFDELMEQGLIDLDLNKGVWVALERTWKSWRFREMNENE